MRGETKMRESVCRVFFKDCVCGKCNATKIYKPRKEEEE